jgi:hypothetical protein
MTQIERDENLMLVVAVEEYSYKYNLTPQDTLTLFMQNNIHNLIRKNYGALHTQNLDESFYFAEDILARKQVLTKQENAS